MSKTSKAEEIYRKFIRNQPHGKRFKLTAVANKCRSKGLPPTFPIWNLVTAGELRRAGRGWYVRAGQ
jgi:hypothetical protein